MSAGRRPTDLCLESWLSGLRRTTGNRVTAYTRPRVQIPNSPRENADSLQEGSAFLLAWAAGSQVG